MNKKIVIIIVSILVIGIMILSATIDPEQKEKNESYDVMETAIIESNKITDSEKKDFIYINVDTYLEYYQGTEKKIVLMARPTCQYCQIAEPILQKIAKEYQLDIYYLNTSEVNSEDQDKLINSNELFQANFGTPFLVIIQNEQISDHIGGLTDTNHYLETFKNNGMI
jgi:predicted bacteriocin transport accessory protein